MKVLITSTDHRLYNQVGVLEGTAKFQDGSQAYVLRVGDDHTYVLEGQFKVIKVQDDAS